MVATSTLWGSLSIGISFSVAFSYFYSNIVRTDDEYPVAFISDSKFLFSIIAEARGSNFRAMKTHCISLFCFRFSVEVDRLVKSGAITA